MPSAAPGDRRAGVAHAGEVERALERAVLPRAAVGAQDDRVELERGGAGRAGPAAENPPSGPSSRVSGSAPLGAPSRNAGGLERSGRRATKAPAFVQ